MLRVKSVPFDDFVWNAITNILMRHLIATIQTYDNFCVKKNQQVSKRNHMKFPKNVFIEIDYVSERSYSSFRNKTLKGSSIFCL